MSRLSAVMVAGPILAACSQTAALAPVGGADLADLRYAVNDVLVDARIDVLRAPVCVGTGGDIACTGETLSGEKITAAATSADASTVEVRVGSTVLYAGSVQEVLDREGTG